MTAQAVGKSRAHRVSIPPAQAGTPAACPVGRPWPLGATLHEGGVNFAVYASPDQAESAQIENGVINRSVVGSGSIVDGATLDHAMLRRSVMVERGANLEHCIIMERSRIGRGAQVRRCIIDQDNDIPPEERIGFDLEQDRKRFHVTPSGIVVVPAGFFPARKTASSHFHAPMDDDAQMGESVPRMEVLA